MKKRFRRPNISGKKPRIKKKFKISPLVILLFLIIIILYFYFQFEKSIMPSVLSMAEFRAKSIATEVINSAIKNTIDDYNITSYDLVSYIEDSNGNISSVQIDTIMINGLTSDVIKKIDDQFSSTTIYELEVPLGNITGSELLANYGPVIDVMIMPIGTATIDYDREFRSAGINQINHRVWLNIGVEVQIVVPMATETLALSQQFVLVDHIFKGEVPPNYVNVPSDNLLDVAPDNFTSDN